MNFKSAYGILDAREFLKIFLAKKKKGALYAVKYGNVPEYTYIPIHTYNHL